MVKWSRAKLLKARAAITDVYLRQSAHGKFEVVKQCFGVVNIGERSFWQYWSGKKKTEAACEFIEFIIRNWSGAVDKVLKKGKGTR